MIRICPKRDAACPHGMGCPYSDGYDCLPETPSAASPEAPEDVAGLVARLRASHSVDTWHAAQEAASALTRIATEAATLRARIAELEGKVERGMEIAKPFAEVASEWDGEPASLHVFLEWNDEGKPVPSIPVDDFRAARRYVEEGK